MNVEEGMMATQILTPAAPSNEAAKPERQQRSWSVHLVDGAGARLLVTIEHRRDGSLRTFVQYVTGKGKTWKSVRGASSRHADEKSARAAQNALVATALKTGWTKRETRGGGFTAKPESFDVEDLPQPVVAK